MAVVDAYPDPPEPELRPGLAIASFGSLKYWLTPNGWQPPHRITQGMPKDAIITRIEPCYEGTGYLSVHFVTRERCKYPLYVTEETFYDHDFMERVKKESAP